MSNKEIQQDNKLIAEFMGVIVENSIVTCKEDVKSHNERCLHHYNISQAKYHSSWDWLMPVIAKITSTNDYIEFMWEDSSMLDGGGIDINPDSIEEVFKKVVEFIKWQNGRKT